MVFDTSMFDTWINEPPVEVIEGLDKVQVTCTQFELEVWNSERPETVKTAEWDDRKDQALYNLDYIENILANTEIRDQYIFYVYKPGKAVGLMSWWKAARRPEVLVPAIAMLPGWESAAAILIEYAVELSKKAGYDGRTRFLNSQAVLNQWLQSRYVVPRDEKDVWMEVGGKWRLKKLMPPLPLPHWSHFLIGREVTGRVRSLPRLPGQPKLDACRALSD